MKVGDLITTYYKGYFILDRIEKRFVTEEDVKYHPNAYKKVGDEYSPLFYFTKWCDDEGNYCKPNKQQTCDSAFCNPAEKRVKEQSEKLKRLETMLRDKQ